MTTGKTVTLKRGQARRSHVTALAIDSRMRKLFCGINSLPEVRVVDLDTWNEQQPIPVTKAPDSFTLGTDHLVLSSVANLLVSCGTDGIVRVGRLNELAEATALNDAEGRLKGLAVAPNGGYAITAPPCEPNTLGHAILWDLKTKEVLKRVKTFRGGCWAITVSPDGEWLALGSREANEVLLLRASTLLSGKE